MRAVPPLLALWLGGACATPADETRADDTDVETTSVPNAPGAPVELVHDTDVPYPPPVGGDADMALLDITYVPDGSPRQWLVFVHGGSWVGGDKSNLDSAPTLVPWFLSRGFAVAAPNFRLASRPPGPAEVTWAEQLTDLAHALAFLEEHRADYGVTEPGIVLLGYSSGAHLVALLTSDPRFLEGVGLEQGDVAASISFDVHAYDVPFALSLMKGSELAANIPLIEHLFGDEEADQRAGSPSTHAPSSEVPPTLLISADPSAVEGSKGYIAATASERYAGQLTDLGRSAQWVHFDDETHSSLVLDFGVAADGPTETVEAFLRLVTADG